MPKKPPSFPEVLILLPWWFSVGLAVITYVGLAFILPTFGGDDVLFAALTNAGQILAPYVGLFLLILAGLSAFRARRSRRLVDEQTSLDSLREIPWKRFEDLVGELYRREGYAVEESLGGGADGGIDLVLRKNGEKVLVQCKRWKGKSVGASIVRELYGLMVAEGAASAKLVTTSAFTKEAVAFAAGKPLELIDGRTLVSAIRQVQKQEQDGEDSAEADADGPPNLAEGPNCPKCGAAMILRTARRGENKGQQFWGCSSYPKCRGILEAIGTGSIHQ